MTDEWMKVPEISGAGHDDDMDRCETYRGQGVVPVRSLQ
jgi:hypothetical protein